VADQNDVRRLALALPGAEERGDRFAFAVAVKGKLKDFAWVWVERVDPRRARVPRPDVLAVRVANEGEKQLLVASDGDKFFTEPHYNGFPAVLVRLPAIEADELAEMLADAWRCQAPRALVAAYDEADDRARGG
jgi:hypothetical protein